jgi:hypothetical protein
MSAFRTLDHVDVKGKRVLVRVDLNVPVENGVVTDSTRIERMAHAITEVADKGAKVILLSHFGRPKGRDPKQSLKPVAAEVAHILKRPVKFVDDCIGETAERAVAAMKQRDIVCLENTRIARMPRPRVWGTFCRPMPDARCRPNWRPSRKCSTSRRTRSRPSLAAPRFPPSSICSAICSKKSTC